MSSHFMPRENHCSALPGSTGSLLLVREEVGYLGSIPPLNFSWIWLYISSPDVHHCCEIVTQARRSQRSLEMWWKEMGNPGPELFHFQSEEGHFPCWKRPHLPGWTEESWPLIKILKIIIGHQHVWMWTRMMQPPNRPPTTEDEK